MDFTPVERRMKEETDRFETTFHGRRHAATPCLDESPLWWKALLLPPLVMFLTVALTILTIWDWIQKKRR